MKARVNEILESFREFVSTHDYEKTPILTAYVNIDPSDPANDRARPAWQIELKNESKKLEADLDADKLKRLAVQKKWTNTADMVMDYLQRRKPTGRSVVLFTDHEDFMAIDLPVPVTTRLYYGLPQIKQLLFSLDQYKKYLVVLLSGVEVRVLEVFLTRTTDEMRVETEHRLEERVGRSGHAHKKESRAEEYERRFTQEVANEINQYFLSDPDFERLILGGNLKQAHAVRNSLHPAVREMLIGIESIDFKLPSTEVAKHVTTIADGYEMEHDMAVVENLLACCNRAGTAVIEWKAVEAALSSGKVKSLVVPYPIESEAFNSLVVEATRSGAEIEFVFGEAADKLNKIGGIGAMLYYSAS